MELTLTVITRFAHSRSSWFILAGTALGLELSTVFSTYNETRPCVMCIYQRLAVFGFIGGRSYRHDGAKISNRKDSRGHCLGSQCDLGLKLALSLVDMQTNPSPFSTCSFLPEFPAWMPLHEWFLPLWCLLACVLMCLGSLWGDHGRMDGSRFQWLPSGLLLFIVPILSGSNKPSLYK